MTNSSSSKIKLISDASKAKPLSTGVVENPWDQLRAFTDARIGLGRAGVSIPTQHLLKFQLAHAQAQDAVHLPLSVEKFQMELDQMSLPPSLATPLILQSQAIDRATYLQRPDLGRRLNNDSVSALEAVKKRTKKGEQGRYDLAIVVVDGLSSLAVQVNAAPFIDKLNAVLDSDTGSEWRIAPLTVVKQGRVAVGDEVGELLGANAVLVMVGERPGLSSPDSLGLYLTWAPKVGLTDAYRNCISNVREAGLPHDHAAHKLMYLLQESKRRKLTGVQLKERSEETSIEASHDGGNFLTS